jgi:hypothetical protein
VSIVTSVIISIISSIKVSSSYHVGVVVPAIFPPLAPTLSIARVMPWVIVIFIVAAWTRFSHIIFSISPTVGDFHQLGDTLWLLSTKFFNVRFPSNALTEGVDCSVDRNIFDSV